MSFTREDEAILNELSELFARFIYEKKGYDYLNQLAPKKLDEAQEQHIGNDLRALYDSALKFRDEQDEQAALKLAEDFLTTFSVYKEVEARKVAKEADKSNVAKSAAELSDIVLQVATDVNVSQGGMFGGTSAAKHIKKKEGTEGSEKQRHDSTLVPTP